MPQAENDSEKDYSTGSFETYINMEVFLPRGDNEQLHYEVVKKRVVDNDGIVFEGQLTIPSLTQDNMKFNTWMVTLKYLLITQLREICSCKSMNKYTGSYYYLIFLTKGS